MAKHTPETQEEEQTQALQNLDWDRDAVPFLDEDGARLQLGVDIIEIDEGAVASSSIDISGASVTLEKAGSGTGAYDTSGVTQPSLSKSQGRVEVDEDLASGEWTAGDAWRLTISGVKADDSEGNTYNLPTFTWSGGIGDWGELKADIDQIDSDIGSPTSSPTASATGNLSERLEELLANRLTSTRAGNLDNLDAQISTRSSHAWNPDGVLPTSGAVWARQSPDEGQVSSNGTNTVTVFALGTVDGSESIRLEGCLLFVTLNDQSSVDLKLNAEINGTVRQIGSTHTVSSTGGVVVTLTDFGVEGPITAPRLTCTVTGADGSPATEATVDRTIEHAQGA